MKQIMYIKQTKHAIYIIDIRMFRLSSQYVSWGVY